VGPAEFLVFLPGIGGSQDEFEAVPSLLVVAVGAEFDPIDSAISVVIPGRDAAIGV